MRRTIALSTPIIALAAVLATPLAAQADGPDCPSGSTESAYRTLEGTHRAKTCFKGVGDWFYWQDMKADGISAYATATFYVPGQSGLRGLRSDYDSDGANNGWNGATVNIDESRALTIYACSFDGSEGIDYGCGPGTSVPANHR